MTVPPIDYGKIIGDLIAGVPITGVGGTPDENRAFFAALAQRGGAAMSAAAQLAAQQQNATLRMYELAGMTGRDAAGNPILTDASQRWRQELGAQERIQNARLNQDLLQAMGYQVKADGSIDYNAPTLASRQLAQQLQQQREAQTFQTGERTGTQAWQSGESKAERDARLALQNTQDAAEMARLQAQLGSTASENKFERDLREKLQAGVLNQQESEFARKYLLERGAQSGYVLDDQGNSTGRFTEESRAAREGERTQRAALAAQLMAAPKDVFKAGAYFRSLGGRGASPYSMGLGGGGISGFNSLAQRAQGTPGSATLEDVDSMYEADIPQGATDQSATSGVNSQELQAMTAPSQSQQAQAATGTSPAPTTMAGTTAAQAVGAQPMPEEEDAPVPGAGPAGPVGTRRPRRRRDSQLPTELMNLLGQTGTDAQSRQQQEEALARQVRGLERQMGGRSARRGARARANQEASKQAQPAQQQAALTAALVQGQQQAQQAQAAQALGGAGGLAAPAPAVAQDPTAALAQVEQTQRAMAAQAPAAAAQAEQIRMAEVLGGAGGTDAAARWQSELAAQTQAQQALGGASGLDLTTAMAQDRAAGIDPNAMTRMITDPGQGGDAAARWKAELMAQTQAQMANPNNVQQLLGGGMSANERYIAPSQMERMPTIVPDSEYVPPTPEQERAIYQRRLAAAGGLPQGGQDQVDLGALLGDPSAEKRAALAPGGMGGDAWNALQRQRNPDSDRMFTTNAMTGGAGFGMGGGTATESTTTSGSDGDARQDPSALGGSGGLTDESKETGFAGFTPAGPVGEPWLSENEGRGGGGGKRQRFASGTAPDPITALIADGWTPPSPDQVDRRSRMGGMGAGGAMVGRSDPDGMVPGVIPYVDPQVLSHPEVEAMVQDVRAQGVEDDRRNRRYGRRSGNRRPLGPAGPQDEPLRFDAKEADRRRWSDERFLRGLSRLNRRGVLGAPGAGPGGPVDAPLVPEGGSTAMPVLQEAGSVGAQASSFQDPIDPIGGLPPNDLGLGGMDQGNQAEALNYMSDLLVGGVGNQDPQFWQKLSKTQQGMTEGALEALGLNIEDFEEAVAQTRFANVGNVLSA